MTSALSIAEAAAAIRSNPAPIVLADTGALLDILRVTLPRENAPARIVTAAKDMIQRVSSTPRSIWILAAAIIEVEWKDNVEKVSNDSVGHVANIDRALLKLHEAIASISSSSAVRVVTGRSPHSFQAAPHYADLDLPKRLREMAEQILASSLWIAPDEAILRAAHTRSMAGLKPAATGKRERPDCQVVETYFAVCNRLRTQGFKESCVFVSSNKADFYGEGPPLRPHEDLAGECTSLRLQFALDFSHALSLL